MKRQRILRLAGIALVVVVVLTHLIGAPQHYRVAPYIGIGFVANFIGALVAAIGIYRDAMWGWVLGAWSPVAHWSCTW
jgi:hypothetical protein